MNTTAILRGSSWAFDNPPPADISGLDTVEQTVAGIAAVVAGKHDRMAECIYVRRRKARCVIARLLIAHGCDLGWLSDWQMYSGRINADELAADLGLTRRVGVVLQAAQAAQDGGTLGAALIAAQGAAAALLQAV